MMLWIVLITSGGWNCARSDSPGGQGGKSATSAVSGPAFTDVTVMAGLGDFRHDNGAFGQLWFPEQMGAGGGFIDYDGDGWIDILLVGGGVWAEYSGRDDVPGLWLYRNNGDGTFSLKSKETGLAGIAAYGIGISVADYDNDGDPDFYFTTIGENMLFRNDGGVFTSIGKEAGVSGEAIWSASAMFFDGDRDGWLDLFVANYAVWSPETDPWCTVDGETKAYCPPARFKGLPSSYYRNNGDGTFTELTEAAGLGAERGKSLGIAEMDFNRDGWPDFVVANDGEPDQFYENNGDGTYTEKGMLTGMAYGERGEARAGMGIDVGIVDNSGQPSIFVGNFSQEMIGVYRYDQNGWFQDRAAVSRIGRASLLKLTFGVFLFDVDFDGDLDLFAANGHVYPVRTKTLDGIAYRQTAQLFLNAGDGTFEEANQDAGGVLQEPMVARGAAYADFDRDGDLDILITENGGPVHLWRNELEDGHYLRVRLEGVRSNRDGIGSNITAVVGNQRMERRIRTASSYLSQLEMVATFGLGEATVVDSLLINWPSGSVEHFVEVAADQDIRIVEGSGTLERQPIVRPLKAAVGR